MFLALPAARCLRSLTIDLGHEHAYFQRIVDVVTRCGAPLETFVIWVALPDGESLPLDSIMAMPYLHTFVLAGDRVGLPEGDANVAWTGQASSIRGLGRAATGRDPSMREPALARIRRMGRNSGRYLAAIEANEPSAERRVRIDNDDLLAYAIEASSLEHQRAQLERDGVHPRWSLHGRWRALVPIGSWFGVDSLENMLREHNKLHASAGLEPLSLEAMADDPHWVEFRRQAAALVLMITQARAQV